MSTAFHRGTTHVSTCKIGKKKFETSLHPDPEWLFGCLIKCNRICTALPVLNSNLLITAIITKVSELEIKVVCYDKEENFTLCDIMRSSHNVHLSNQNKKCSTLVAL